MSVVPWDENATVEKMSAYVRQITQNIPWVEMIMFHELAAPGVMQFDRPPEGDTQKLYQPIPGPLSDRLCSLAKRERRWLLPGSLYEKEGEHLYNTAIVISPDGDIVVKYRKLFPWCPFEDEISAGDAFGIFEIPEVGRFGLSICYDMWFPETVRALVWSGAEVILHPTLTTSADRELELVLSQAHAITNQCYFIDINGVGPWGGGSSQLVDPDGRVLQRAAGHETVLVEMLDLDKVSRTRKFGTLGLTQSLKQLRDSEVGFPQHGGKLTRSEPLAALGRVELGKLR